MNEEGRLFLSRRRGQGYFPEKVVRLKSKSYSSKSYSSKTQSMRKKQICEELGKRVPERGFKKYKYIFFGFSG